MKNKLHPDFYHEMIHTAGLIANMIEMSLVNVYDKECTLHANKALEHLYKIYHYSPKRKK